MTAAIDVVRYRSSLVRCPLCRKFREQLVITAAGSLRCEDRPVLERRRQRDRKGAAA